MEEKTKSAVKEIAPIEFINNQGSTIYGVIQVQDSNDNSNQTNDDKSE